MATTTLSLIAFCAMGVFGEIDHVEVYQGVLVFRTNTVVSVAVGGFIAVHKWLIPRAVEHEYGHHDQEEQLGALYLPIVALPSVALNVAVILGLVDPRSYYLMWPESWADELGGVKR